MSRVVCVGVSDGSGDRSHHRIACFLAEAFGHEAAHGVFALFNKSDAVRYQKLANEIKAATKSGYPYPPDVMEKISRNLPFYAQTEQYAQQAEQFINGNLRRSQDKE